MDTITFRIANPPARGRHISIPELVIQINGQNFQEMVREAEIPSASREGQPELAGSYCGLDPRFIRTDYLLGQPHEWLDEWPDETAILRCYDCGEPACWSVHTTITVTNNHIQWANFRHARRHAWTYGDLGPFTFDRHQYEAELAGAVASLPHTPATH
jgi:hypothetical protein